MRSYSRKELGLEPIQHMYIDVNILKNSKYIFFTEVESKPRDTSENAKIMFREELKDIQALARSTFPNYHNVSHKYISLFFVIKSKIE